MHDPAMHDHSSPSEVPPDMCYLEENGKKYLPISTAIPTPKHCDTTEDDREKNRMIRQAKLAYLLKIRTARRLLGEEENQSKSTEKFVHPAAACRDRCNAIIMQKNLYPRNHENHWVLQLPNVLLQVQKGETILGTLEAACGNGFTFTASGIHVHFKDTSVAQIFYFKDTSVFGFEDPFFGDDNQRISVLQFHLREPMMVEARETKDIMFVSVSSRMDFGKELENFVNVVAEAEWDSQFALPTFQELGNCKFNGILPSGSSKLFAVTSGALILLGELPCTVIPAADIEIVDLVHGSEGIDMTVVFKDFEREVLQVNSIYLGMLQFIKICLDWGNVKYYCRSYDNNRRKLDWNSKLREILKCPEKFVESGGWESLGLEDPVTLSYYRTAAEWQPKSEHWVDMTTSWM